MWTNISGAMSKTLLIAGLAVGLCSLTLNVLLGRALLAAFAELQYARIFPVEPPDGARSAGASAVTGTACIAMFGDSRVLMWGAGALGRECPVRNFGRGGFTSSQLLMQLQTVERPRTRWSIVQIGINDIHPIGALPDYKEAVLAGLHSNFAAVVGRLLQRSDFVIVSTIIPPGHVPLRRRLFWDPSTLAYVADVNQSIRLAARRDRIFLLDAAVLLKGSDGYLDPQYADSDFFLHINQRAYDVLNAAVLRILRSVPAETNTGPNNSTE